MRKRIFIREHILVKKGVRDNETVFDVFGFALFLEGVYEVDETATLGIL